MAAQHHHAALELSPSTKFQVPPTKMSNLLAYRLKMKLPKSEHPEEYLKHVRVIQCMANNCQLQCNHCSKVFKGRPHRAVCHLIGKTGEGVSVCADFPKEEKMEFIKKV